MNEYEFMLAAAEVAAWSAEYVERGAAAAPPLPLAEAAEGSGGSVGLVAGGVPGALIRALPRAAPDEPEEWTNIFKDFKNLIMLGVTHWNSPHFHAYYPAGNSYPSMLGEMLSATLSVTGFTWLAAPASTELEMTVTNWLGKMIGLPEKFLFQPDKDSPIRGGGVIQGTASEANAFAAICARERKRRTCDADVSKMVLYASEQAHVSAARAAKLAGMRVHFLAAKPPDYSALGQDLEEAASEDQAAGFTPAAVIATLGTTSLGTHDDLKGLGIACKKLNLWLHVDAAYAGGAFVCSELRSPLEGIENADSINLNAHKMLLTNFDCAPVWFSDVSLFLDAEAIQGGNKRESQGELATPSAMLARAGTPAEGGQVVPDYRHWQIPFGRRFRSLKLWFVLRSYGQVGVCQHVRNQIRLAKLFEASLIDEKEFQLVAAVTLGIVCFTWNETRVQGDATEKLFRMLTLRRRIHLTRAVVSGRAVIRFVVCSRLTDDRHVQFAVEEVREAARQVLADVL